MNNNRTFLILLFGCLFFSVGTATLFAQSKRKVALVVTWQNDLGRWYASGTIQTTTLSKDTEEDAIGYTFSGGKGALTLVATIGKYKIYAAHRRLEGGDYDARNFLARNGIQFDTNPEIDRIEQELASNEGQKQQQIDNQQAERQRQADEAAQRRLREQQAADERRQQEARDAEARRLREERQAAADRQQAELNRQREEREQQVRNQQNAAQQAQRQKEVAILGGVAASQQVMMNGIRELERIRTSSLDTRTAEDYQRMHDEADAERERKKQERLAEEEEKKQREREEEEEQQRQYEKAMEERRRIEEHEKYLSDSRLAVLDRYDESDIPLSGSNTRATKLYYFVYSADRSRLKEDQYEMLVSNPFEIGRRSDGTWPFKKDVMNELSKLVSHPVVFHGYYPSMEQAIEAQTYFVNKLSNTGIQIKTFRYQGKKAAQADASTDFWGAPAKQSEKSTAAKSTPRKATDDDFWGAPAKK